MPFGVFPNLSELPAGTRPVSILASAGMLASSRDDDGLLSVARCFFLWRSKYCGPEPGMLNAESEEHRWFDHRFRVDDDPLAEHHTSSHEKSDQVGKGTSYVENRR